MQGKLKIKIDPKSATPLWRQLEESVRHLVGSGAWGPDLPVPSVRALAAELLVNPATIAKAYQRLVDLGVLVVRRGEGTFVAPKPPILARAERTRTLREGAEKLAVLTATIGAEPDDAFKALEVAFEGYQRVSVGGKS
ncbi:MAG: GntR family transcriptional regulator [Deltaproteobacteria bacterium]|nr:GntR family transcriptional regulator [Deltaproteobacteria bacterium]MDQ3296200.1 GntR family transcriptional regulator [Myxococcota bacterium]